MAKVPRESGVSSGPVWSGSASVTESRRSTVLCLPFFLSGAASLLFETLWFRLAALAFGNSVWASSGSEWQVPALLFRGDLPMPRRQAPVGCSNQPR